MKTKWARERTFTENQDMEIILLREDFPVAAVKAIKFNEKDGMGEMLIRLFDEEEKYGSTGFTVQINADSCLDHRPMCMRVVDVNFKRDLKDANAMDNEKFTFRTATQWSPR